MIPRLGEKYDIEIETISKPMAEYSTAEYFAQNLPKAPAIMFGDEVMVKGRDVSQENLEMAICKSLGLPKPELPKKRIFSRFLHR